MGFYSIIVIQKGEIAKKSRGRRLPVKQNEDASVISGESRQPLQK